MLFRDGNGAYCLREKEMPKTKKAKKEGLEKHRQMLREKKMKLKARKQVSLPQKHVKGKKRH